MRECDDKLPGDALAYSMAKIWEVICAQKDLNLPAHKVGRSAVQRRYSRGSGGVGAGRGRGGEGAGGGGWLCVWGGGMGGEGGAVWDRRDGVGRGCCAQKDRSLPAHKVGTQWGNRLALQLCARGKRCNMSLAGSVPCFACEGLWLRGVAACASVPLRGPHHLPSFLPNLFDRQNFHSKVCSNNIITSPYHINQMLQIQHMQAPMSRTCCCCCLWPCVRRWPGPR